MTDLDRYRLDKLRRLDAENAALRRHRGQLERVLALAVQVAVGRTETTPAALLAVLERADRIHEDDRQQVENALRVLRETA